MRFPAVVALALLLAPTAAAKTLTLNWVEKSSTAYGFPAMTFTAKSITVTPAGWTVAGSVTNRSHGNVNVTTTGEGGGGPWAQFRFGLILPPGACKKQQLQLCNGGGGGEAQATVYAPRVPSTLKPGQTWRGTFSGRGRVPHGVLISIAFGYFSAPDLKKDFAWLTTHEFKL